MEVFPTIARNVRRIGPRAAGAIAWRVVWYLPAWGIRRWFHRPGRRHVERAPW